MNRAIHGDRVCVRLFPPSDWARSHSFAPEAADDDDEISQSTKDSKAQHEGWGHFTNEMNQVEGFGTFQGFILTLFHSFILSFILFRIFFDSIFNYHCSTSVVVVVVVVVLQMVFQQAVWWQSLGDKMCCIAEHCSEKDEKLSHSALRLVACLFPWIFGFPRFEFELARFLLYLFKNK